MWVKGSAAYTHMGVGGCNPNWKSGAYHLVSLQGVLVVVTPLTFASRRGALHNGCE